jgi:hypothetical protein
MKNKISEQALLKTIKTTLDESALQLEPYVTHRLQQARQSALMPAKRHYKIQWAGAFVISLFVVMLFWHGKPEPAIQIDDLLDDELMLTEDNQELIMNIDFYSWLESTENQG